MAEAPLPPGEITGNVLLYTRPEPLSLDLHRGLGMNRTPTPFVFAAKTHMIPLTVTEFANAALSFPVIFVGEERQPVAVMGLREGENLFITPEGGADENTYIPAYMRRYPFVFANDDAQERMILCIDRAAKYLAPGGDLQLFDGDQPSTYTNGSMEFCREFEVERQRTEEFVKLLVELDLFEVKQAVFTPRLPNGQPGEPQQVAEYFGVSEAKLNELPDAKIVELQKNGALAQIYAHLVSLLGWNQIVIKALAAQNARAANAN
jgi:hypothetical protein